MSIKTFINFKKALLSTAITLTVASPSFATLYNITGTFRMYDVVGGQTGVDDSTLLGTFDDTDPDSMVITTAQPFFGFIWDAHDLKITQSPSTITVETCPTPADDSVVPEPGVPGSFIPCVAPLPMSMTIGDNQWGVQMLFDWNTAANIDVLNVWDVTVNPNGSIRLTSTDFDGDGILSSGMADGAFQGFNASFDLLLAPPFPIDVTTEQNSGTPILIDPSVSAGNVTLDATVTDAEATSILYNWATSDTEVVSAAVGTTSSATLVIDQTNSGLVAGETYDITVSVTKLIPNATTQTNDVITSSTNTSITIAPFALSALDDSDADGTTDDVEGFIDTDGDNIPEFIDTSTIATELTVNPADNSLGLIKSSSGILALGDKALLNAASSLSSASDNSFGAAITVQTLGVSDSNSFKTICTGGCVDVTAKGITGSSVQIVMPVSSEIPDHALVRLHTDAGWNGFISDSNNSLSSAAATTSSPIDCPTPGVTAYTTGLSKGKHCIQLTIEDGGPNDADGFVNGSVSVTPGVAELIISPPTTNGVGSLWGLLFCIPALLGFRRFSNK